MRQNLSDYDADNYAEFFAEVFANSQLGDLNEPCNAMREWLKKKEWQAMTINERPYFMANEKCYYHDDDDDEFRYKLTVKAPPEARKSYKEFYK